MNEWMAQAACADSPLDFTPEERDHETQQAAAVVCRTACPVRDECAKFAAANRGDLWGVYAGTFHAGPRAARISRARARELERKREAYIRSKEPAA